MTSFRQDMFQNFCVLSLLTGREFLKQNSKATLFQQRLRDNIRLDCYEIMTTPPPLSGSGIMGLINIVTWAHST